VEDLREVSGHRSRRGKIGIVLEGFDQGKNASDLLTAETRPGVVAHFGLGGFRGCANCVARTCFIAEASCRNSRCAWYWETSDRRFCGGRK